ncbi:hypothetical protein Ddye_029697 [Dipteronia dyeriana]|uniref:Uncharacterized protein n=1 Tax=Dipteronia dyeriana TaxID=168575 RepID=A0AAD9WLZ0_9ROSI|nr:hypothetical protein Ddye_029697 [Dipteronia dyeriana]
MASMKEIRDTWKNLSMDEKLKYTMPKNDIVDENGHVEETTKDNDIHPFDTRSFTLDPIVFSHIMGISNGEDIVHVDRVVNDNWRTKFSISNRGIKLPYLEEQLKNIKISNDDFKIAFCLYLFGVILAPAAGE